MNDKPWSLLPRMFRGASISRLCHRGTACCPRRADSTSSICRDRGTLHKSSPSSPHCSSSVRSISPTRPLTPPRSLNVRYFNQHARNRFSTMAESRSWWRGSERSPSPTAEQMASFDPEPLEIPEETQDDIEYLPTRRVHILGLGSIGTLIAHSLKVLPNPPPISLLMHKPAMYDKFKQKARIIRLQNKKTDVDDEQTGYDVDVLEVNDETRVPFWRHIPDTPEHNRRQPTNPIPEAELTDSGEVYIYTLIVTVKGPATVNALASIKHRVNKFTTICLMQNGMGQIDELNRRVFTDPQTRPTYMLGIISHGAYMQDSFYVIHAGFGSTALGIYRDTDKYPLPPKSSTLNIQELSEDDRKRMYPSDKELYSNLSSRYLLRTLTRSPVLACASFPYLDLFQLQLEKLAMNAVLNPLTALLNIPNGSMLGNDHLTRAQRLLLAEISLVLRGLPELESIPGVKMRFSSSRLEALFLSISTKTARNSSSMREDMRNLKQTEIEYINGYIVRRGEEQGIKCVLNYLVMQLIQGKSLLSRDDIVEPYSTSSVEGNAPGESSIVTLEDRGTQSKGLPY